RASPRLDSRGGCLYMSYCSPLCLFEQARQPDQENGADDRHYDASDNAASGIDAERIEYPSADDGADDAEDNIHHCAIAAAFHDLACGPSCDQSDDEPPNEIREHASLL